MVVWRAGDVSRVNINGSLYKSFTNQNIKG